jgi:hypothetical protein
VTCSLDSVPNGGSATVTLTVQLNDTGANVNTATVTSGRPDANAADDSASATTTVSAPAPPGGGGGGGGGGAGGGGGGGGGGPGPDVVKPVFTRSLSLKPSSFTLKRGTKVSYSLSEAATVTFTVERATTGRRVGGKCVKATKKNRKARRCTLFVTVSGHIDEAGKPGANSFTFKGKLGRKSLKPGRYRLVAVAKDAAGNKSAAKRANFTVKK